MSGEIISVEGKYYVLATSALADDRTRVLKHGDTFAVFDRYGDVHPLRNGEQGIYHGGTRHLSRLELLIDGRRPFLLSSSVLADNTLLTVDLTNPDLMKGDKIQLKRGSLHVLRSKFLYSGACFERLAVSNFGTETASTTLTLQFDGDFVDIFEVRGHRRAKRGVDVAAKALPAGRVLGYRGLDGLERTTEVQWRVPAGVRARRTEGGVEFILELAPQKTRTIDVSYTCLPRERNGSKSSSDLAWKAAAGDRRRAGAGDCGIETSSEPFNRWLERSFADIHMMTTRLPEGLYPYAGVPWYSTVFGRDGILTALSYLWVNPELARGVLGHLAANQALRVIPERDAEPGKILHESRSGEMAVLREHPFGLYYGSVNSTPLFVVLAGAYFERTGDLAFARKLWPAVERALEWIERYGDADGDGFLEYRRLRDTGLLNQGWKDSNDAVFHADGRIPDLPIALCEVQGYAFDAWTRGAELAAVLGHGRRSSELRAKAESLRRRFEKAFWNERLGFYALALDGEKKPCLVRSSNAGHVLFSGLARPDRARRVGRRLLGRGFNSGWGIRTVSTEAARFNPMSYHNGSIWPHDNALIAAGLARYGDTAGASAILRAMFDASQTMDLHRLPELYCGFDRRPGEGPTNYPRACSPQAWASASVFLLLKSVLGMTLNGTRRRVVFDHPRLPDFLREVRLRGLRVGTGRVDITLVRHRDDVGIHVTNRSGDVEVVAVK